MKVYTRTGDKGSTGLYGGKRVSKSSVKIEAYGSVDELNANVALLRDKHLGEYSSILLEIQNELFVAGSHLACDKSKSSLILPSFNKDLIKRIEDDIDNMETKLIPLTQFVLPGGHELVSYCHVVRTVCRRTERVVVALTREESGYEYIVQFLNRLSDFLFVYSRILAKEFNVVEVNWKGNNE